MGTQLTGPAVSSQWASQRASQRASQWASQRATVGLTAGLTAATDLAAAAGLTSTAVRAVAVDVDARLSGAYGEHMYVYVYTDGMLLYQGRDMTCYGCRQA